MFAGHSHNGNIRFPFIGAISKVDGAKKYDDCSYYLNSLEFSKFFSCFEGFPEDTLVCVRRMTTAASIKGKKKTEKHYNNHIEYYEDILNFVLPEGWKPEAES